MEKLQNGFKVSPSREQNQNTYQSTCAAQAPPQFHQRPLVVYQTFPEACIREHYFLDANESASLPST